MNRANILKAKIQHRKNALIAPKKKKSRKRKPRRCKLSGGVDQGHYSPKIVNKCKPMCRKRNPRND